MLAVDDIPCAMMVTDAQGHVLRINAELLQIVGGCENDWRGRSMEHLLPPASRMFAQCYIFPMLHHEQRVKELYLHLVGTDGSPVPVMLNATRRPAAAGSEESIVWAVFIALERSRFEAELIQARADAEGLAARLAASSEHVERLNRELSERARRIELRNHELSELSLTDPLTGLKNRRALELAVHAWQPVAGQSCIGALLLADVDHFKRVNDSCGHAEGDRVLVALGQRLRACARTTDLVVRLGGEEFVLWLPGADDRVAQYVAGRLHQGVRELRTPLGALSVSVGLAAWHGPASGDLLSSLLRSADKALYEAKTGGRDRTVCAAPLPEPAHF